MSDERKWFGASWFASDPDGKYINIVDEAKQFYAETDAIRSERDALAAKWDSVPWEALYDVIGDIRWEECSSEDTIARWYAAHAPKEPTE